MLQVDAITWHSIRTGVQTYLQLIVGSFIGALSVVLFLVPSNVVPSGVTGTAVLINHGVPQLPIGAMVLAFNIPILYLGYRLLPGGWRMIIKAVLVVFMYSLMIDWLSGILPPEGFSDDRLLNAIFGGITGGLSGGIVYRTGANFGGTSTLALILQRRTGTPMSTTFLYTDALVIIAAGFVFGIEGALYAFIVLVLGGIATDYVMEGPAVIRTVIVITRQPEIVAQAIMAQVGRGVTAIPAKGMYTGEDRWMLYVTVSRSQVADIRQVVTDIDPNVFIVIGQGHAAYGQGFKPIKPSSIPTSPPDEQQHPFEQIEALRDELHALQERHTR